ncbi:hypothetical protein [Amycolatopsis taiwanensis]|nr:hypothetical protein [Amycolatopsis taiwanensis]
MVSVLGIRRAWRPTPGDVVGDMAEYLSRLIRKESASDEPQASMSE